MLTPHPARWRGWRESRWPGAGQPAGGGARLCPTHGVTLVLKGARTLIAHPDGRVAVNTTGNPGMAKGGSGDLLTGLIAGMLAQYPAEAARAVEAAVYLHGLAADLAVRKADEHTLLARTAWLNCRGLFAFAHAAPNGYLWLQGLPAESGHVLNEVQ